MGIADSITRQLKELLSGSSDEPEPDDDDWTLADHTGFDGSVEDAEVVGRSPLSYVAAGESVGSMFGKQTAKKLADHGIDDPQPDEWYPLGGALAMLYEMREEYGADSMQTMGRHIPQHVEFPPELETVEEALRSINEAYHQNHSGDEIGFYEFQPEDSGEATIVCENPYPCELDQGLIAGVAREFTDSSVTVDEIGDHCRMKGDQRCEYRVKWVPTN